MTVEPIMGHIQAPAFTPASDITVPDFSLLICYENSKTHS